MGAARIEQTKLHKDRRLRKKTEFLTVQRKGKSWAHPLLILRALPNDQAMSRFGFLVSGKVGNAVVRNRVKRRLKEIAQREQAQSGWDMVFIARPGIVEAPFVQIRNTVHDLLRRARLGAPPDATAPQASKLETGRTDNESNI